MNTKDSPREDIEELQNFLNLELVCISGKCVAFKYGSESNRGNVFDTEFECLEVCGGSQSDRGIQGSGDAEDGQGLDRDGRQLSPDEAASVCRYGH